MTERQPSTYTHAANIKQDDFGLLRVHHVGDNVENRINLD